MKYFYDTEFLEDGKTIELISIGIVAEDGREYYAVSSDMPVDRIRKHDWLVRNVLPHLPVTNRDALDKFLKHPSNMHPRPSIDSVHIDRRAVEVKPRWVIANEVREFILYRSVDPELWAWYSAYDHVVLAQLFGPMVNMPNGIPMFTNDVRALMDWARVFDQLPKQGSTPHNALEDARHVRKLYEYITARHVAGGAG